MAATHSTREPSRLVQIQLSRPAVIENPDASFRPPSRVTLSDGRSHSPSSREKAYRRLVNSAARKPLLHVDLLKSPSSIMSENTAKKVPVVKLKVGEFVPSIKRSHTIAQMNNLRGNFGNYSHYRIDSAEKRLPSLSDSSHGSSHGDNSVVFILRGRTGSKSPKRSESQSSVSMRSPMGSTNGRSPLFKRTFKLVRSTERTGDLSSSSLNKISDYEIRGNSLMKGPNQKDDQIQTNGPSKQLVKKSSAPLLSRPSSYLSSKKTLPHTRDYSAFDRGEGYLDEALVTRAPPSARKVHFDETKRVSNTKLIQDRVNQNRGRHSFGTRTAVPLQLTVKNLEMFEYLSDTKQGPNEEPVGQKVVIPNHRVLSWVQNTPPISDIPEEPELDPLREIGDQTASKPENKTSKVKETPKFVFNVTEDCTE